MSKSQESRDLEIPAAHTPGPWMWKLNLRSKEISLEGGKPQFDLTVLDFVRWGMGGAKVRFRCGPDNMNIMEPADLLGAVQPGREHHADWFQLVKHPDAQLIEAAPDLLEACKNALADIPERSPVRPGILAAIAKATKP